jgi:NADPH-dependent F420 reductase
MTVAIIGGTGEEGFGLAVRLGSAGVPVLIGSRAEDRGKSAAAKARELAGHDAPIDGTSNEAAAAAGEVVLVTVPFAGQADIYRSIKDAVQTGAVVCDATSPLASAIGRPAWQVLAPWEGSAAEQAKAILPSHVRMVAGFHTISADLLHEFGQPMHGSVLLCGADAEAKAAIGELVEKIPDLEWIDAGPLSMARIIERLTAVMISVNRIYGIRDAGVVLTGRDSWGRPPRKE